MINTYSKVYTNDSWQSNEILPIYIYWISNYHQILVMLFIPVSKY